MSRLVILFSLGSIRRVAINSTAARIFYQDYPEHDGQLVLLERHQVTFGRLVFAAIPRAVMTNAWYLLWHLYKQFPSETYNQEGAPITYEQ